MALSEAALPSPATLDFLRSLLHPLRIVSKRLSLVFFFNLLFKCAGFIKQEASVLFHGNFWLFSCDPSLFISLSS